MKSFLLVLFLAGLAASRTIKRVKPTDWLIAADEKGRIHVENLREHRETRAASESDVILYLYTNENPDSPTEIPLSDPTPLQTSNFNAARKTVFVAHGWNNDHTSTVFQVLIPALLQTGEWNVFAVDWSSLANGLYTTGYNAVVPVGSFVGAFVQSHLVSKYRVNLSDITAIGHSLGAHVAGAIGASLGGKIGTIIGMDPAGPLFDVNKPDQSLDPTDAIYVEAIHTDAGYLGIDQLVGHNDFFPNGGVSQPGCGIDLIGTCAHSRSYYYTGESILGGRFISNQCSDYNTYVAGSCSGNPQSYMGGYNAQIDTGASGTYYLSTSNASPYALG